MKGSPAPLRKKKQGQSLPTNPPSSINSATHSPLEGCQNPPVSKPADHNVGYLGSTAFNAVFTDNQEHIPSPTVIEVDASNSSDQLHEHITASWEATRRRVTGDASFVLTILNDFPLLEKIVERWTDSYSIIGPWLQGCRNSIRQDIVEKYDLTDNNALPTVISLLGANTANPLQLPAAVRFRDFASFYTGSNIRWETIGVFLTACGLSLSGLAYDGKELQFAGFLQRDKQSLMARLLEASDVCVSFCGEAANCTDLAFWLMVDNCTYATLVLGDAHISVWRRLGDLSTAIFARGLHANIDTSAAPFWLKEMRRRGLGCAYILDKTLATFVGRPPRISKRYCKIDIPLDLEYHELALEGDELDRACSELDAAGWSTQTTQPATERFSAHLRACILEACVREETLELCLGPPQEDIREKAEKIINQCKELYVSLPLSLDHSPEAWASHGPGVSFQAVWQYLDHIYNEFMLRRMLVRRLHDDPTDLVLVAHKILAAILESRDIRGALPTNAASVCWTIVLHGLPAAGVLALELLQLNVRVVPHARIKQDLCVFISYLKWVHVPGDGNYSLADRGRKTLQHILDKVLSQEPLLPTCTSIEQQEKQQSPEAVVAPNKAHESVNLTNDLGVYDFSWLDTDHFDQEFWDSLNSMDLPTVGWNVA